MSGISEENNSQKNGWIIGGAATGIVFVVFVESRQINVVINELLQCKFKRAGLKLLFAIEHHNEVLVVAVLLKVLHGCASLNDVLLYQETPPFWSFSTASTLGTAAAVTKQFCVNIRAIASNTNCAAKDVQLLSLVRAYLKLL